MLTVLADHAFLAYDSALTGYVQRQLSLCILFYAANEMTCVNLLFLRHPTLSFVSVAAIQDEPR
jgi:hypothetical protein